MRVVRVPRASQRLLAFLALHGQIVGRAALAGVLWPEASEPHAYSSLRAALARLQCTARMAVAASQFELGLAEGVTVDIHHAKALARRLLDPAIPPAPGDLGTSAVMALSADLLPDWYDDWVLVEARTGGSFACMPWKHSLTISRRPGAGVRRRPPPVPPCGENHSGKPATRLSSGFSWLKAMCPRPCASSRATRRCFTTNLASNRPPGCAASSRTRGTRNAPVTRRRNDEMWPRPAPGC